MQICYTSDLHGLDALYDQLDTLVRAERPDVLILGGDLFADGTPADPFETQGRYIRERFLPWVAALSGALPSLRVGCINGNHDWGFARQMLAGTPFPGCPVLLNSHRACHLSGLTLLGYSCAPPAPFGVKDFERLDQRGDPLPADGGAVWDLARQCVRPVTAEDWFGSQPTIADELAQAAIPSHDWIFVCHAPPYGSGLDRLPSPATPLGSRAVRAFIEQARPRLALHGHFHESPYVSGRYACRIGETLCINPGQDITRLHAVLLDPDAPERTLRHTVLP